MASFILIFLYNFYFYSCKLNNSPIYPGKEPRPRETGYSPTSIWDEPGVLFCIGVAHRRLIFQCCIHPQGRTLGMNATITVKDNKTIHISLVYFCRQHSCRIGERPTKQPTLTRPCLGELAKQSTSSYLRLLRITRLHS